MNWLLKIDKDTGRPIGEADPLAPPDDHPSVLMPDAITLDDLSFATFNFEKKKFIFEMKHYVTIDPKTGMVKGDVVTNRPVKSDKYTVIDVTDMTKDIETKVGHFNGKRYKDGKLDGIVVKGEK